VYITKIGGKVGNMIEDLLKEGIAMPVKKWHVGLSCFIPLFPLHVVNDPDEFHQKLMEDRWRAVSGGYGHDDKIHVDAKARKVDNGYHGANSGDGSLCLGLVCVKDIYALFCVGDDVSHMLLLDHACVSLRKKCQWVDGICFVIEGSNSVSDKVSN
jgi:hypothetical protein